MSSPRATVLRLVWLAWSPQKYLFYVWWFIENPATLYGFVVWPLNVCQALCQALCRHYLIHSSKGNHIKPHAQSTAPVTNTQWAHRHPESLILHPESRWPLEQDWNLELAVNHLPFHKARRETTVMRKQKYLVQNWGTWSPRAFCGALWSQGFKDTAVQLMSALPPAPHHL